MLIERATPSDLMALASDMSGAPLVVGAVLVLDSGSTMDLTAVQAVIADRIRSVPRLPRFQHEPTFLNSVEMMVP